MVLFISTSSDSDCVAWARLLTLFEPQPRDLWHDDYSGTEYVEVKARGIYA